MKTKKLFLLASAAVLLTACSKNHDPGVDYPEGKGSIIITLNSKVSADPRADGGTENGDDALFENTINVLEFFIFNDDGTKDAITPYFKKTTSTGNPTSLEVDAGSKKLLVSVNQNIDEPQTSEGYNEIKEKIATLKLNNTNSRTAIAEDPGFAMAGEGVVTVLAGSGSPVTVDISRLLSKVEAPVIHEDGLDISTISGNRGYLDELFGENSQVVNLAWELEGYTLINGINLSYSFQHENDFSDWQPFHTDKSYFATTYTDDTGKTISDVYSGMAGTTEGFLPAEHETPVFVYENNPSKVAGVPGEATLFKSGQVYAFLIKGKFIADGGLESIRYWRINLIRDDVWKVYRNSIYQVRLKKLLTHGYETPKEAEITSPVVDPGKSTIVITLDVKPWNIKIQDVEF